MQKKLLVLFMVVTCRMIQASDYTDELIAHYTEAFCSGTSGAVDKVYNDQKAANTTRRTEARSHQCNGRHLSQPDENSVTGCKHKEIEEEYSNNSKINDELFAAYKNNFNLAYELSHRIYVLKAHTLESLEVCGKDKACLLDRFVNWEDISSLDRLDRFCSSVYNPVLYQGKIVLTREQKIAIAQDNQKIKELDAELNDAKKAVRDKIDILNK